VAREFGWIVEREAFFGESCRSQALLSQSTSGKSGNRFFDKKYGENKELKPVLVQSKPETL
jgi:hypothetical protein